MSYLAPARLKAPRPLISKADLSTPRVAGPAQPPADLASAGTAPAAPADDAAEIDLRQLRHHTKNTLQRLIGMLAEVPGLMDTPTGEMLARELEYRICLSAQISNALFGLTQAPGPMAERLRMLAGALVELMRGADQVIRVGVSVKGCCPPALREAVLRSAHELIGNAVKHGMKDRPSGRITVRLVTGAETVTLSVNDNGWGFDGAPTTGEGLSLARSLVEQAGGTLELDGADGTLARVTLPLPQAAELAASPPAATPPQG